MRMNNAPFCSEDRVGGCADRYPAAFGRVKEAQREAAVGVAVEVSYGFTDAQITS
jgi:hypothetical protein